MKDEQLLTALAAPGAVLAPRDQSGRFYGVYPDSDRRRRPRLRASASLVRQLCADGALAKQAGEDGYRLTGAGKERLARQGAHPYLAQHGGLEARATMAEDGQEEILIAQDPAFAVARLAKMKTPEGTPWLDAAELAAARRLALDAEAGARGGLRLSRWAGYHAGGAVGARGSNGAEAAMTAGFEARQRVQRALSQLAGPLRTVAHAVCLEGVALEALERRSAWPARSARVALKLALSQLATVYRGL